MKRIRHLKEMLIKMRDLSDLMIELGYAAIQQDDIELAEDSEYSLRAVLLLLYAGY
jgi:uncharacterized protein with PhoU and TrkA domain